MLVVFLIILLTGRTFSTFSDSFNDINAIATEEKVVEIETFITDKCANNGANVTFSSLMSMAFELKDCIETYFNVTKVQQELEKAKINGSLDEVTMRYCMRYPQIYECLKNASDVVQPCLNSTEQELVKNSLKLMVYLKKYICFKDGTRIAMFIAAGGLECMDLQKEQLQECIGNVTGHSIESLGAMLQLVSSHSEKGCESLMKIRSCFYHELNMCEETIPANIVEATFKFFKKEFSCKGNNPTVYKDKDNFTLRIVVLSVILVVAIVICYFLAK
ncbi:hypothetical protein Zmor_026203 [Zophobas morio]|uniref:27 kDa hemolymph protein n=1 Tax=Zophobas morio TaxID=2755281 RepID=A0AA38HT35_9CUCU|nr:hypothetical protein Zmor_026203 [Zophobas morio]